jgi:hypothetical protein
MIKGNEIRIAELVTLRKLGTIAPEQMHELQRYFDDDPRLEPWIAEITSPEQMRKSIDILLNMDSDAIRRKVEILLAASKAREKDGGDLIDKTLIDEVE